MTGLAEIQALYREYLDEALRVELARKPMDGVFGLGKKPSDDPCHERFAAAMEAALKAFADTKPDSAAAREVLAYIYEAPVVNREPLSAYWMLTAVHGFTLALIESLNPEDAAALLTRYGKDFRRWNRLPVQQQVYAALKRVSKC